MARTGIVNGFHLLFFSGLCGTVVTSVLQNNRPNPAAIPMERSLILDGKGCKGIEWTIDKERRELVMAVESAPGADWVAVGIAEFGGMKGADIAMIRMTPNGDFEVDDLFSDDYEMPRLDFIQNVELLSAVVNDQDRISAIVRRPLESCDEDDLTVTSSKQSIICASGSSNTEGQPLYHGNQRSKATVNLVFDEALFTAPQFQLDSNASPFHLVDNFVVAHGDPNTAMSAFPVDFQMPNVSLNNTKRTTYLCHVFEMPMDMNVVGYEAVWNNGTTTQDDSSAQPQWLHHQEIRNCQDVDLIDPAHRTGQPFECGDGIPTCDMTLARSQTGRTQLPAGVHIPLRQQRTYMLQIHYDNAFQQEIEDDTSGIRVWIEPPTLPSPSKAVQKTSFRANLDSIRIPADPNQKVVERQFMISSEATRAVLPSEGIQIFGSFVRMHVRGARSTVKLIRNGVHISNVYETKSYDFGLQTPYLVPWKLLPSDAIIVSCFYTPHAVHDIVGGLNTTDEICDFDMAHATELNTFNFGVGFMVEPSQPFLNSYMGTTEDGKSYEEVTYSQSVYLPDSRDFVPLEKHRVDLCDVVIRSKVGLNQVRWSSLEIPAQSYMLASIGLAAVITILLSKFVQIDDIRMKRNTVVYALQLIFSLVALPVVLYYTVDIWEPVKSFDTMGLDKYAPVVVFIISQPMLYLLEIAYRIDIRPEILFHHLLTSGTTVFLCWVLIETFAFTVVKLGLLLTLMSVTEQPMYVALLLKNVGYGNRRWWPALCRFAGWFFIFAKAVILALVYVTLIQAHTGKDASWKIGSHSFSDWNADNSVPITSTILIVIMSIALSALFVAQVMGGRTLLVLAKRTQAKLKLSSKVEDDTAIAKDSERQYDV